MILPQTPKNRPQGDTVANELFIVRESTVPNRSPILKKGVRSSIRVCFEILPFTFQILIVVSWLQVIMNFPLQLRPIFIKSALCNLKKDEL